MDMLKHQEETIRDLKLRNEEMIESIQKAKTRIRGIEQFLISLLDKDEYMRMMLDIAIRECDDLKEHLEIQLRLRGIRDDE